MIRQVSFRQWRRPLPAFETESDTAVLGNSVDDASVNAAKSVADTFAYDAHVYDEFGRH